MSFLVAGVSVPTLSAFLPDIERFYIRLISSRGVSSSTSTSGYNEIQKPRRKCALIDYERLRLLTGFGVYDDFSEETKQELGIRANGRKVLGEMDVYQVREPEACYKAVFGPQNNDIGAKNAYFWNNTNMISR